jgi:hypothetical protein
MNDKTMKISNEVPPIPMWDVLEKISTSAIQRSIAKGISPSMVSSINEAKSFLTDYFASSSDVQYLSMLNSSSLSKLRIYLRVFAPDNQEVICVSMIEAAIAIGVELECVDPVALVWWRKVGSVQYFRDTPLF